MSEVSIIHKLDISSAPLPVAYENAKVAISECNKIDECKDWSDKAQALASYARQSGDDELEQMSKRIRVRAMRRCGELLKMFDAQGKRNDLELRGGNPPKLSKVEAGNKVGLSNDQIKTANRLSNIPEDEFNNQVEANQVPTLTALSEQGKKAVEILTSPKPEGFAEAIHFIGSVEEMCIYMKEHSPEYIINAIDDRQKEKLIKLINYSEKWFDKFMVNV